MSKHASCKLDRTSAEGTDAKSAGARSPGTARTSAKGAHARSVGARAPAPKEQMQRVRGRASTSAEMTDARRAGAWADDLPAPAPKEQMLGVRREHLPARAPQEPMQGVQRGGGQIDAGRPGGARGCSACCRSRPALCYVTHVLQLLAHTADQLHLALSHFSSFYHETQRLPDTPWYC